MDIGLILNWVNFKRTIELHTQRFVRISWQQALPSSHSPSWMQSEKLACGKIVPRDLFRGPFHTTTQCESGTFYDALHLVWVLPLRSVLHSRLLVAINEKSFLHQFRIRRLPAVEEKPSICVTCTVKHLQEALSFIKNSSKKWSKIKTDGKATKSNNGSSVQRLHGRVRARGSLLQQEVEDPECQFRTEVLPQLIYVRFIQTQPELSSRD